MRYFMFAILIVIWVTPSFSADLSCLRDKAIEDRISKYDNKDFYSPQADEALLNNHRNSVCLLINNLKIIPLDTSSRKFWNVIATLAVLEELTGKSMSAKTTEKFLGRKGKEREEFISARDGDEVIFVGFHMKNSQFFIAPKDAQLAIIEKWKAWYKAKSE